MIPRLPSLFLMAALTGAASATPPPPLPPKRANLALAVAILREHHSSDVQLTGYADWQARNVTKIMLQTIHVPLGGGDWFKKYDVLYSYLLNQFARMAPDRQQQFIECMANQYAYMSLADLKQVRQFLRTDAGRRFWEMTGAPDFSTQLDCARRSFGDTTAIVQAGWKVIGVEPPPAAEHSSPHA
jgi:hypothetical protein